MNRYLFLHEMRQGFRTLVIWTLAVSAFMIMCVFFFPEMGNQMESVGDMFATMGTFSAAFGLDRLNFGSFIGFYAIECGNIILLGGALFAALLGVQLLSKEEDQHTAEFLLSQPVARPMIVLSKLSAALVQLVIFNIVVTAMVLLSIAAIGEPIPWNSLLLLHTAFACVQVELFCICFAISAFLRHALIGLGLGLSIGLYFLQIVANISDSASWLSYLTPFGYADSATIVADMALDGTLLLIGGCIALLSIGIGIAQYATKDISA